MRAHFSILVLAVFAGAALITVPALAGSTRPPHPTVVTRDQFTTVCPISNTINWHDDAKVHIWEEFAVGYLVDPKVPNVLHLFQHEWRNPGKISPGWKDCGEVDPCWPSSGFSISAFVRKPDTHDYDRIVRDPGGSATQKCWARFNDHDHDTQLSYPIYEMDDGKTYPVHD